MDQAQSGECPGPALEKALAAAGADDQAGLAETERLAGLYPADARLHFLRGSLLAGMKRYEEALAAMRQAVEIAPGFAVARFQLGLLELSSGDAVAAEATWRPLEALPGDNPLRLFATGLVHMIGDDFTEAMRLLRGGIALNAENPAINGDMALLVEQMEAKMAEAAGGEAEPTSLTHFALQQFAARSTKH